MNNQLRPTGRKNLYRNRESGTFFAFARICGKLFRKTLKTDKISVAEIRLAVILKGERERRQRLQAESAETGDTFKSVADAWAKEIEAKPDAEMKPRARKYRIETLAAVRATWPGLDVMAPSAVTEAACKDWAARLAKRYSPSRFNGAVETLRAVFARAVQRGHAALNPAMAVERMAVRPKARTLPTADDLRRLLAAMEAHPARRRGWLCFRFLMFSGFRPAAAVRILPGDVDLARNEITAPPIKHQAKPLTVPMSDDLRKVVVELLADREKDDLPLLPILCCKKALAGACKEAGIARLTPYAARHIFTTTLIESGIPVALVGAMRGDGAASIKMMLDTYVHVRNETLHEQMKKVKPLG